MPLLERSALSIPVARAVLPSVQHDPMLHAGTALMLLVGLRPGEVSRLTVADYEPGPEARLTVDGDHRICIAPSAAASLDAYLASQDTEPDEPLLFGFDRRHGDMMRQVFTRETKKARLHVSMHDLRQVAMMAALEDGAPVAHIDAYFRVDKSHRWTTEDLADGYDAAMARTLEAALGA